MEGHSGWSLTDQACHCEVQEESSSELVNIDFSPSLQGGACETSGLSPPAALSPAACHHRSWTDTGSRSPGLFLQPPGMDPGRVWIGSLAHSLWRTENSNVSSFQVYTPR